MGDEGGENEQKEDQVKDLGAAKKRNDQEKRRLKDLRKAEELEKKTKLEAIASAAAAEAAAIAAVEQARLDAKAAVAAEEEAQRLAKIAVRKSKKNKGGDLDDLSVLELAIADNDTVGGVEAAAGPAAVSKSLPEAERDTQLLDALKSKKQLAAKSRRKVGKAPKEAPPSEQEMAKAAALASAAEIQRNRNIQKAREAYVEREKDREQAKPDKTKLQLTSSSPVAVPKLQTASSMKQEREECCRAEKMLQGFELELVSLEAEVVDSLILDRVVVLDRVTELMIKLDGVPVSSTELRNRRRSTIARAEALAAGVRDSES